MPVKRLCPFEEPAKLGVTHPDIALSQVVLEAVHVDVEALDEPEQLLVPPRPCQLLLEVKDKLLDIPLELAGREVEERQTEVLSTHVLIPDLATDAIKSLFDVNFILSDVKESFFKLELRWPDWLVKKNVTVVLDLITAEVHVHDKTQFLVPHNHDCVLSEGKVL